MKPSNQRSQIRGSVPTSSPPGTALGASTRSGPRFTPQPKPIWALGRANGSSFSDSVLAYRKDFQPTDLKMFSEHSSAYPYFHITGGGGVTPLSPRANASRLPIIEDLAVALEGLSGESSFLVPDPAWPGHYTVSMQGLALAESFEQITTLSFWEYVYRPLMAAWLETNPSSPGYAYAGGGWADIPTTFTGRIDSNFESSSFGRPETTNETTASKQASGWGTQQFEYFRRWCRGLFSGEHYANCLLVAPYNSDEEVLNRWYYHHIEEAVTLSQLLRARAPKHAGHSRYGSPWLPAWYDVFSKTASQINAIVEYCVSEHSDPKKLKRYMEAFDYACPSLYVAGQTLAPNESQVSADPYANSTWSFSDQQRRLLYDAQFAMMDRLRLVLPKLRFQPYLSPVAVSPNGIYGLPIDKHSAALQQEYLSKRGYSDFICWGFVYEGLPSYPNNEGSSNAHTAEGLALIRRISYAMTGSPIP